MRSKGDQYEKLAVELLKANKLKIITTNYCCTMGEIDIIAEHSDTLIFVEVKYRKNDNFGSAISQVTATKQAKIRRTAELYLKQHNIKQACRFDVIGFTGTMPPQWISNAF